MDTEPLLIPIPAVQAKLGHVSRTTVHELFKSGELTKVRIGSRSFATLESVTAYVARLSGGSLSVKFTPGVEAQNRHNQQRDEGVHMTQGLTRTEQAKLRSVLENVATDISAVLNLPVELRATASEMPAQGRPLHIAIVSRKPARSSA